MKTLHLLLLIFISFSIVLHATRPIVPLYATTLGLSSVTIGLMVSIYSLFPMLLAIQFGKWLDQFGPKRMIIIGGMGTFLAIAVPAIYPSVFSLFFSQVLIGCTHMCSLISLQKTVWNKAENPDKGIATLTFLAAFGGMIGPLFSGYSYDYIGFQYTFGLCLVIVLIGIAVSFTIKNLGEIQSNNKPKKTSKNIYLSELKNTDLRNAIIIGSIAIYSREIFVAYFPVYGTNNGLSPSYIGIILSILSASMMVIRLVQFNLVKLVGRSRLLFYALIFCSITYFLIPLTTSVYLQILLIFLLGCGLGLGQPLSLFYVLQHSPKERQGVILGIRMTMNRASLFVAPILFGGVGFVGGIASIFYTNSIFLLAGSFITKVKNSPDGQETKGEEGVFKCNRMH